MAEHAAPVAVAPGRLLLPPNSHFFLFASHQGHQIVVISRKKAADTGSLLTHFICLALGSISMKQEELYNFTRGATLSWISQYAAGSFCLFSPPTRDSIREAWPP